MFSRVLNYLPTMENAVDYIVVSTYVNWDGEVGG